MIIEPLILSIIVAKLRKGKFKNLENIEIKAWYLLLIAAGIQIVLSIIKGKGIILGRAFFYLHIISYILMIVCIILNIKKKSMKAFLIGVVLNFIVIFANGGKMPVSLEGIKGINNNSSSELQVSDSNIKHQILDEDTKFAYLADIVLVPEPYPLPKIISIGDIFIMAGLFIFIQEVMVIEEKKTNPSLSDL